MRGEPPRAVRLALVDRLERHRREPGGQHRHRRPSPDLAGEPPDRDARHHAAPGVDRVRDRLDRVRAHAPRVDAGVERLVGGRDRRAARVDVATRLRAIHQRLPDPVGLRRRVHEQHRQEPQALAHGRAAEADRGPVGPIGPSAPSPAVVATQNRSGSVVRRWPSSRRRRREVVGHRRLVEPALVVLDARPPDPRARVEIGLDTRPVADGMGRPHRYSSVSASADGGRPVASRSSSACMNASRSPSSTAPVFDVS